MTKYQVIIVGLCLLTSCATLGRFVPFMAEAAIEVEQEVADEVKQIEVQGKVASTTDQKKASAKK